jgi:hypothetical protein
MEHALAELAESAVAKVILATGVISCEHGFVSFKLDSVPDTARLLRLIMRAAKFMLMRYHPANWLQLAFSWSRDALNCTIKD